MGFKRWYVDILGCTSMSLFGGIHKPRVGGGGSPKNFISYFKMFYGKWYSRVIKTNFIDNIIQIYNFTKFEILIEFKFSHKKL